MEGPVLGCYCTQKEKQEETKSPRVLGTNFNIADGQVPLGSLHATVIPSLKGFCCQFQHALITQQQKWIAEFKCSIERSLKDIYFLVRYSHFQDDLLIYSLAFNIYVSLKNVLKEHV